MDKIYDFHKRHPKYLKVVIWAFSFWTLASLAVVTLFWKSDFSIYALTLFPIFAFFLYKNISNINKPRKIIFKDDSVEILWNTVRTSINETIKISRIKKIIFWATWYSSEGGGHDFYDIEIVKEGGNLKFFVTMMERNELMKYFKEFCELHKITFRQVKR